MDAGLQKNMKVLYALALPVPLSIGQGRMSTMHLLGISCHGRILPCWLEDWLQKKGVMCATLQPEKISVPVQCHVGEEDKMQGFADPKVANPQTGPHHHPYCHYPPALPQTPQLQVSITKLSWGSP